MSTTRQPATVSASARWRRAKRAQPDISQHRYIGSRDRPFAAASLLVALWAVYQNFDKLGTAPIVADEPTYIGAGWSYLRGRVAPPGSYTGLAHAAAGNFEHPPLAKYLFGLAQWIAGTPSGLTASRAVSALATVLAGAVAAVWIGRAAGRWTGLLAGALVTVLPEPASGSLGRFDRFAMLDPVASLFVVLAVALAWEWAARAGRSAWVFAGLTGVAVGCAAGAKENGFLGAVGPAVLVLLFAALTRRPAEIAVRCAQAALAVAVSLLVFVALYLPFGRPAECIRYLIKFQSAQSSAGHLIGFAGRVSAAPPWWANPWFAGHDYGPVLTVFLAASAVCALVLRRDRLTWWCLAALAAPFVFHCFVARVALGYYWVMWAPLFLLLAALGAAEVIRRAAQASPRRLAVPVALLTGVAVLAVPAGEAAAQSRDVARIRPTGVQALAGVMRARGLSLSSPVVSAGIPGWDWSYYLPRATVYPTASGPIPGADVIAVSTPQCRDVIDPSVRALVAVNLAAGSVQRLYRDSALTAYAVTAPLTMPSAEQIAAQPVSRITDGC